MLAINFAIVERYGLSLSIEQVADAIGLAERRNRKSAGTLGILFCNEGDKQVADAHEVARYIDERYERARQSARDILDAVRPDDAEPRRKRWR